jgi:hypothetical protein
MVSVFVGSLHAQKCTDFHLAFCPIPDFSFYYDQQSTSIALGVGESAEVKIIVYENTDYYISVCKHRKFNTAGLKIFEDTEEREVLFDNSTNAYIDSVKFHNKATRKLILEVSIPEDKNDRSDDKKRCAGVMIASRMHVQ